MCGIFGLLLKESYNIENDTKDKYKIKQHFKFGKKRGPEYSTIKNITPQIIWGFSSPLYQWVRRSIKSTDKNRILYDDVQRRNL